MRSKLAIVLSALVNALQNDTGSRRDFSKIVALDLFSLCFVLFTDQYNMHIGLRHLKANNLQRRLIFSATILGIAALAFVNITSEVERVMQCVEREGPERLQDGTSLYPVNIIAMPDTYIFVHAFIGWHMSWAVLFDVKKDEIIAYETYGADGSKPGPFGRIEVPRIVQNLISECGAEWKGLWPNDWPEKRPETLPADDLLSPEKRPQNHLADDLLPPRQ